MRMEALETKTDISYVDTKEKTALKQFYEIFYEHLRNNLAFHNEIILLCIGTDRVTGDSLGPLVGYKLIESMQSFKNVKVYGTLEQPVHAKNIQDTITKIYATHVNPLVIAIDACLGKSEHIGYVSLGKGSISPGAGLNKRLPSVGDIFITGVVNLGGSMDLLILQNTRLHLVMKMADLVHNGILKGILKLYTT